MNFFKKWKEKRRLKKEAEAIEKARIEALEVGHYARRFVCGNCKWGWHHRHGAGMYYSYGTLMWIKKKTSVEKFIKITSCPRCECKGKLKLD